MPREKHGKDSFSCWLGLLETAHNGKGFCAGESFRCSTKYILLHTHNLERNRVIGFELQHTSQDRCNSDGRLHVWSRTLSGCVSPLLGFNMPGVLE